MLRAAPDEEATSETTELAVSSEETGQEPTDDVVGAEDETTAAEEIRLFTKLALPSVLIQVCVLLTSAETAMFVGRCTK